MVLEPMSIEHQKFPRPLPEPERRTGSGETREDYRALIEAFAKKRDEEALSMDDPYFRTHKDKWDRRTQTEKMRKQEERFEKPGTEEQLASAFEYVVAERLNGPSKWLGPHMRAQLTTKYDDYVNKTDLYLEDVRSKEGNPVGLSVDVTFSRRENVLEAKLEDLKSKLLDGGRLGQLSYYKPLGDDQGTGITSVALPRVIVGIERARALDSLARLAEAQALMSEDKERDLKTGLTILYQIAEQLKAYRWYSETKIDAKERPHVAAAIERYGRALADITAVLDELGIEYGKLRVYAVSSEVTRNLDALLARVLGYQAA